MSKRHSSRHKGLRRKPRCLACRAFQGTPHVLDCPLVTGPPAELPDCPDCGAPYVNRDFEHEDGCPYLRGVEAASDNDKRWFEEHPGETIRIRPPFPAEQMQASHVNSDEPDSWVTHVTVRKWNDECRVRRMHTASWIVLVPR